MTVYDRNPTIRREIRRLMAEQDFKGVEEQVMNHIHWRSSHHGIEPWSSVHSMLYRKDPMGFLLLTIMLDELDAMMKERTDG